MNTQRISLDHEQTLNLLDGISDALVLTGPNGEIVHLNASARQLDGVQAVLEQTTALHLDDLPLRAELINISLDNLQVYRVNSNSIHIPSSEFCAAWHAIEREPGLLTQILDNLGLCVLWVDGQERVHAINTRARTFLGLNRTAPNRPLKALVPSLQPFLRSNRNSTLTVIDTQHSNLPIKGCLLPVSHNPVEAIIAFLDPVVQRPQAVERVGLLRMLIHDLSNPLYIALNFARMLQDNVITGDEAVQASEIIINNLQRMQDLLADLSTLEQLGENITDSFEQVEITMIAATVIANLEDRAQSRGIGLGLNPLPTNHCYVYGNERLLRQAVHNLVENAIKYTLPGGWVRLTVRPNGSFHQFLVADSGIGISPAKSTGLFSPFYRVKDPRTLEVTGTGLGLSLVKMVANQHQGDVQVHSVPERGSIFVLEVPRYSTDGERF